jgi:TRAP-type C4-dicarboxylate transport system permease small subunit
MDMLKLRKVLDTFLVWAVCILTTVLLVVMSAQVLWRYVFNDPIYWSEELARYLFVWLTFLAASMAFRDHKHMAVDLIQPFLGPEARRWQQAIITGILAIFFVVVLIISPEILGARSALGFFEHPDRPVVPLLPLFDLHYAAVPRDGPRASAKGQVAQP